MPEGYLPLRQQLVQRLAYADIHAEVAQIVTTNGVTHAIDLVARHFIAPGDTVFVEDPAWFVMFGRFAAFGAKIVGVPRGLDGPDIGVLANLLTRHQPKLFVIGSVLHNPTSTSISAANAHRLLKLADQYGFTIVEDDVYGDLHPGRGLRLASLDQLRRVIYIGGFSKTLAANLRVGYIATAPEIAQPIADLKMLTGLTSSELPERVVARVLAEGHYRRHVDRLRAQARCGARPDRSRPRENGSEAVRSGRCRHFPVVRFRSRHERHYVRRKPAGNPVRTGQPVFADATAEQLDARVCRHQSESRGAQISRDCNLTIGP